MRCEVKIPKKLEEKRDQLAHDFENYAWRAAPYTEVTIDSSYREGFNAACNLLLPEIEKNHTALKEWIDFEHSQIDKEGPYVGMEINRLINQGDEALQSLREFLGEKREGE